MPIDRAKLVAQIQHAAREKALDRWAGLGQHAAVHREARPLQREHEIVGRLVVPAHEALGALRAVPGAVDFQRTQVTARIVEFEALRESFGIERAAPLRVIPSADADANAPGFHGQNGGASHGNCAVESGVAQFSAVAVVAIAKFRKHRYACARRHYLHHSADFQIVLGKVRYFPMRRGANLAVCQTTSLGISDAASSLNGTERRPVAQRRTAFP
ncbi:hypothetical protein PSAC2689_140137 [Paraburkholderia sacchari]